jgi:diguanylate cyclase (GGDEF)-like protein/PAS domain S-box-containing protein
MAEQSRPGLGHASGARQAVDDGLLDKARLLDLMPGMIAYFDSGLRFRYANQKYADWRGTDRQSIIGRHCREVVGTANFMAVLRWVTEALEGKAVAFEYDMITRDEKRRVQVEYVPDFDSAGKVAGIVALVIDLTARLDINQRVAESEALFDDAFSNSPIGMALVDTDGVLIRVNANFCSMLMRSPEELVGMSFGEITHPDDIDADLCLFNQVLAGSRDGYKIDKRYLQADGGIVETTLTVTAMRNAAGEIVRFISQIEDITQSRQAQRRLTETNTQLSLAMELVSGGFWHMDVGSGYFQTSERLAHFIMGEPSDPLDLAAYVSRINPEDMGNADIRPLIEGKVDRNRSEYRLRTAAGERWLRCDRKLVRGSDGEPLKIVGMAVDITKERDQLRRTQDEADTDSLTGLLNRRGFEKRFRQEGQGSSCGILALDLDGFKQINDRLGHDAGDQVLVEVARRLRAAVREGDLIVRLGGDEFVVVLIRSDETMNRTVAERIRASLCASIPVNGQALETGCSIGTTWFRTWPVDLRQSLARADAALYRAKAAGKNTWRSG